jgi:hypothetical protein
LNGSRRWQIGAVDVLLNVRFAPRSGRSHGVRLMLALG